MLDNLGVRYHPVLFDTGDDVVREVARFKAWWEKAQARPI
jgi:hypothetical protein